MNDEVMSDTSERSQRSKLAENRGATVRTERDWIENVRTCASLCVNLGVASLLLFSAAPGALCSLRL
jgi:hypothetical protein